VSILRRLVTQPLGVRYIFEIASKFFTTSGMVIEVKLIHVKPKKSRRYEASTGRMNME